MKYNKWTRIATSNDFFDVIESYETVGKMIKSDSIFVELNSTSDYRFTIRSKEIVNFYEHGVEIIKRCWETSDELDELRKETSGWS